MAQTYGLLDYTILGIAHHRPNTGYRIRQEVESLEWATHSSSPGSIYPALKRLVKKDCLEVVSNQEISTNTAIYRITETGDRLLKGWLYESLHQELVAHGMPEVLLRFHFMGLRKSKRIPRFLVELISHLEQLMNKYRFVVESDQKQAMHTSLLQEHQLAVYHTHLEWAQIALQAYNKEI